MTNSIKNTFYDVLAFLKKPTEQQDANQTIKFKSNRLFSILAIDMLFASILMPIVFILEHFEFINLENHKSNELMQLPVFALVLVGAFIIPFIEELIFRSYLRLKYNFLIQPLIYISAIAGKENKVIFKSFIERNWNAFYKSIFYTSALIFALIHLTNFDSILEILPFVPILIAPQFIIGLFIGYLRVKFGVLWGFFLHSLHNLILLSAAIIFMNGTFEKTSISNEKFNLQIEEVNNGNQNSKSSSFSSDSVYFENIKFKTLITLLLQKEEKFVKFSTPKLEKKRINLTFKKHQEDIDSREIVFNELQKAYGFNITKVANTSNAFNLKVKDSAKLAKLLQNTGGGSKIIEHNKEFKLDNINLNQLVKILNSNYKQNFFFEGNSDKKYTFVFKKPSFTLLESVLYNNYGLTIEAHKKQIEYINIDFDKNL